MNPVIHSGITPQRHPAPGATPLPAPSPLAHPSPLLTSAPSTSAKPVLLSLKLNLPKGSGEADGQGTAPGSPSSRSKTKVHRSITATEAGGQKRAIDGKDGPGSTSTTPSKRQKQSTPPGSPRGSTSPAKQLVRQSRPVTDLKTMAGLAPRGSGLASPLSSPRAVTTAQSAPRWRSTSHPVVPEGSRLPSPARPARSGSLSLDPLDKGRLPHGTETPAPVIDKSDENQRDFTFSECDFGRNGELILARPNLPAAVNRLASPTAILPVSPSPTSTLIAAELLPKAEAQKIAAASYLASLSEQAAGSSSKKANLLAAAFKLEQASLETDVTLAEMALEQNSLDDVARYLTSAAERIATLKSGLPALAGHKPHASASAGQLALSGSLDAMEVACKVGLDLLSDEQAPRLGHTSTATQPAQQETPVITPSNQTLIADLDALDALMDEKIQPVTAKPASTAPPQQ
jgi:hypothetical protein